MSTLLDELVASVVATKTYMAGAEAAPEAILWCDAGREFEPVIAAMRERLPNLLTLGAYDPSTRTGPAIWLRAAAERRVKGLVWAADATPIIWMPSVTRDAIRGAEDCDAALQPLVWYAVAGNFFGQPRQSRDWTLRGFLSAQGSPVALDISDDAATRAALHGAARILFAEQVENLRHRYWDAAALNALLAPDPVQDMLRWMDGTLTLASDPERFVAFAARAAKDFGLDPRQKSPQDAAARLVQRDGPWSSVWRRFEETGGYQERIVSFLRLEEPSSLLTYDYHYPSVNAQREGVLRRALFDLASLEHSKACQTVRNLERDHGERRGSVWAKRGEARLALALRELAVIADAPSLPGHDAKAMAESYATEGWKVDAAAVRALDITRTGEDRDAVVTAIRAIYLPWLDAGARAMQNLAANGLVPFAIANGLPPAQPHDALLFVDGLRMDLAHALTGILRDKGAKVQFDWRWSGFPTVTATCKPLVSPAAGLLSGGPADDVYPVYEDKLANKAVLYKAIEASGWQTGTTSLLEKPVWQECGRFDDEGHKLGARLAERVVDALQEVADKALRLAHEGRRVRIVTDHGWLLMPEGFDHAALATGLVEPKQKGSRYALLKADAPSTYTRLPWTWDNSIYFAVATGARAFFAGQEYAHGGLSPQECVLPVLELETQIASKELSIRAAWKRLRLNVEVVGGGGLMLDVRLGPDSSGPSILKKGPRALDDFGQVGVMIPDEHDGRDVCVVVHPVDSPHDVRAKLRTTIKADGP
jgi:hypothetical protein